MLTAFLTRPGGPEVIAFEDRPAPIPQGAEVLVRVRATALNRADLMQMQGRYPPPPGVPSDVPGLEYAGEVIGLGPQARRFRIGERVMGLVGGGAFAEQLCAHEREVLPIPAALSFEDAAAFPEAFLTAFDALVLQGRLSVGEDVLIHAVASGVGAAAVQICRALGAQPFGTTRSAEKLAQVQGWGLAGAFLCAQTPPRFADEVRKATAGRGVNLLLDLVGANYAAENLRALALKGRWMLVGLVGGREATLDLSLLLSQRIQLTGTVLRSRPLEEKILLAQAAERQLIPLLERGALKPTVDAVLPFRAVSEAAARLSRNEVLGKLVLSLDA